MAKQSNLKKPQSVWATIQIVSRQTESARQLVENLREACLWFKQALNQIYNAEKWGR